MNNKKKTKKLTISLLCCGRDKTVEQTLKSIMPIRQAIDSEIQVIDTGCSEVTRNIIEKYADEIFEFTWCNDFSAARNFQLDQANGEWFLYLDDDEFFIETKPFIDFFEKGEYKKFNLGCYYQRNYLDFEKKEWSDVIVARMTSITPQTHFYGKVHEFILPAGGSTMVFDVHAGHFGYLYNTPEQNIEHSMRNIPLLLDMIEEDPDEYRWPYQLIQEYRAIQDFEKLLQVSSQYVDKLADSEEKEARLYRGTFLVGRALAQMELLKLEDLRRDYEKLVDEKNVTDMAKAKLSIYAAQQYCAQGDYEKLEETAKYYLKIYDAIAKNEFEKMCQGGIFVYDAFEENYYDTMLCHLMTCAMRKGDYSVITRYYRKIDWQAKILRITKSFVREFVHSMGKDGAKTPLVEMLKKFNIKTGLKKVLMQDLNQYMRQADDESNERIVECFKKVGSNPDMLSYAKIRRLERMLIVECDQMSFKTLSEAMYQYATDTLGWYEEFNKQAQEKLDETDVTLEVKLARRLADYFSSESNTVDGMKMLKECLGIVPELNLVLVKMSKLLGEQELIHHAQEQDPKKFQEMYNLEEALLNQVASLEKTGHNADAMTIRNQLEGILLQTYGVKTLH